MMTDKDIYKYCMLLYLVGEGKKAKKVVKLFNNGSFLDYNVIELHAKEYLEEHSLNEIRTEYERYNRLYTLDKKHLIRKKS